MSESAQQLLKSTMTRLVRGESVAVPKSLYRLAANVLRNAAGGRPPEAGSEHDLVQDLVLKLWSRRRTHGLEVLLGEWEHMGEGAFHAYLKKALRNLAVERNPVWARQRGLRDAITAALEAGLPEATTWPEALEKNGRYARPLVAQACAMALHEGTAREVKALTKRLMAEFGISNLVDHGVDLERYASGEADALELLAARTAGEAVVTAFLAEVGPEGRELMRLRKLGFEEMSRRLGVALATAHARFKRCEERLKDIAQRVGADREALTQALEALAG